MSHDQKKTSDVFDILINDILNATDEEIIAEAIDDSIDIKQEVYKTKSIFNRCRYNIVKTIIKKQNTSKSKFSNVISIEEARQKIIAAAAENPEVHDQLTMSDEDVMGYYEDFCELGFFSEEEPKEEK